jgi:hypothetical protein
MLKLVETGSFLGSRHLGRELRLQVEALIDNDHQIIIDCRGVTMMTHSFSDELFGKLLLNLGSSSFKQLVKVQNVDPKIAPILRFVLKNRLSTEAS